MSGTVLYLFYDHIGSLRAVANRNGHIVREIEYESFGHVVRDTNSGLHLGYGFAGGLHDLDTGFVRFWVRDYDPKLGRFLSPDPAWQGEKPGRKAEGRARAAAEAGQQVVDSDRYGYCLDDPVNLADPAGLWLWHVTGAVIGGGMNAYTDYDAWKSGEMSNGDYAKSIAMGAGLGAIAPNLSRFAGAAGAGALTAGANEAAMQYNREGKIDDLGAVATATGGGALVGILSKAGAAIGKNVITKGSLDVIGKPIGSPIHSFEKPGAIAGEALGRTIGEMVPDSNPDK